MSRILFLCLELKYPHHPLVRWPISAALVSLSWPISWDWFFWRIYNTGWSSCNMTDVLKKLQTKAWNELLPIRKNINDLISWFPAFQLETNLWGPWYFCQHHPCVQWPVSSALVSMSWAISWYWFSYGIYNIMLKLFIQMSRPVIKMHLDWSACICCSDFTW